MLKTALPIALACCLLSGCRFNSNWHGKLNNGVRHQIADLASNTDESGKTSKWRLYSPSSTVGTRIDHIHSFTETTARIGMEVGPVTRERAESVGVTPFEGVWVTSVEPDMPAASAGLSEGDIVLSINGVPMTSREQYLDYYRQNAAVGEALTYSIRIFRRQGEPIGSQYSQPVDIAPIGYDVRQTSTDSIPLQGSAGILRYTGLGVASLPAELCQEMYGEGQSRLIVSMVVVGTPAYYAGLRVGDRILTCDGEPVRSLDDLREAFLFRIEQKDIEGSMFDLAKLRSSRPEQAADGATPMEFDSEVALEVEGPLGYHLARLGVEGDLDDQTDFYIPILVDYESDNNSADFSFLDFIFQFGFNYDSRVRNSATRAPLETWELSLFPLGMFEFEKGVKHNRYRLFWIINFETS